MTTLIVIDAQHDDDEQPVITIPEGSLSLGDAAGVSWYRIPEGSLPPEGSREPTETELEVAKLELPAIRMLKASARRRIDREVGGVHEILADQARQIEALTALVARMATDYLGGTEMNGETKSTYLQRVESIVAALDSGALTLRGDLESPDDMLLRLLDRANRINEIIGDDYLYRRDALLS